MARVYSFKFVDDALNRDLVLRLKKAKINYDVDKRGVVHYSPDDEEIVENDLICSIRNRVFPTWQILSCPEDWAKRYRDYMTKHGVPFAEELIDDQLCFLLPRKYRPHAWKLSDRKQEVALVR